jgi:hypothetical protein
MATQGELIDEEVAQSVRYIQKQRSMKLIGVVVGLIAAIVIGAFTMTVAYSGGPELTGPGLQSVE